MNKEASNPDCPHGHGEMVQPVNGDPLEPDSPYCTTCGHIDGKKEGCSICTTAVSRSEQFRDTIRRVVSKLA